MVSDDLLWSVDPACISRGDYGIILQQGVMTGDTWFRYGKPIPYVAVAGRYLVVSERVACKVGDFGASMRRVFDLIVTDPKVDWRMWDDSDFDKRREAMWEAFDCVGPEEMVLPYNAIKSYGSLRRVTFNGRDWLVNGIVAL